MNNDRRYTILMATGMAQLDEKANELNGCTVVHVTKNKLDLYVDVQKYSPQIVIVSDWLAGEEKLSTILPVLKREYHYTRFIYLAGQVDPRDQERIDELGKLVLSGIYDLCIAKSINMELLESLIQNPKSEDSVSYLAQNILNNNKIEESFECPISGLAHAKNVGKSIMEGVYVFTSIKPGSGKSFLSVNTACAIARYGKEKPDGTRPRVALIEADLQNLSIGTILKIEEDEKKNMRTAMEAISTIFDKGNMVGDENEVYLVNKILKECMVPYEKEPNLFVLTGSTLTPEEVDSLKISPEYYVYLLEVVRRDFDVVIIDTNSSIFHITTYPLLQKAEKCFYIINLDINNVKNNLRYLGILKKLNLTSKIQWILNENIENNKKFKEQGTSVEKLTFTADELIRRYRIRLTAIIPAVVKSVFLNRIESGTPIVLDKDSISYTRDVRNAILELAGNIWEMEDIKNVKEKKGLFGGFLKPKEKKPKKKKQMTEEGQDE